MRQILDLNEVENQQDYLRYSRDAVHPYSPAVKKLINLAIDHFDLILREEEPKRKAVWSNAWTITPFVFACDYIPLQIADLSRYGKPEYIPAAENMFQIPAECCAMMKGMLGGLYNYRDTGMNKILTFGQRCEAELIALSEAEKFGYEVYLLENYKRSQVPKYANNVDETMRRELDEIAHFLTGKEINRKRLLEEFERTNRNRDKIQILLEKEKKHRGYFRTIPNFLVISGVENYFGFPDYFESIVDEMIAELDGLRDGEYDDGGIPVVWSGARGVDFSVYNALDIAGGYVSAWNLPTSIEERYALDKDPIETLIDLGKQNKDQKGMKERCAYDEKLVKESGAKGIVLYSTLGCTLVTVGTEMKREYLNNAGTPVLVANGTAQMSEVMGQFMTRMKAFIEMIGA